MLFATDLPPVPKDLSPFMKLVLPAVLTLIPAAFTAAYKALQDHSHTRRTVDLTERICKLTKDLSELPDLKATATEVPVTPRQALIGELNAAISEITALQCKPGHSIGGVSTNAGARLGFALLLFRPRGFLAFTLHITFYLYSAVVICFLVSMITDKQTPLISKGSTSEFVISLFFTVILTGIFSVPAVILRNYAVRIHRKQTSEPQPAVNPSVARAMPTPAAGHGD
jgi:hypothetical protein